MVWCGVALNWRFWRDKLSINLNVIERSGWSEGKKERKWMEEVNKRKILRMMEKGIIKK